MSAEVAYLDGRPYLILNPDAADDEAIAAVPLPRAETFGDPTAGHGDRNAFTNADGEPMYATDASTDPSTGPTVGSPMPGTTATPTLTDPANASGADPRDEEIARLRAELADARGTTASADATTAPRDPASPTATAGRDATGTAAPGDSPIAGGDAETAPSRTSEPPHPTSPSSGPQ